MKRNYFGNVSLASLFVLATTAAFGQSAMKANVPFAFNVGNTPMPAGHYIFTEDPVGKTITIRNLDTDATAKTQAQISVTRGTEKNSMQFRRYGSEYFLASVHGGLDSLDMAIPTTNQEKVAKSTMMASAPAPKPTPVQIALR
jgi:hypothetical protein